MSGFPAVPASSRLPLPSGTPAVGQVPEVSQVSPLELEWASGGGSGTVTSVTAGDTSIVVGGTSAAPTIKTGTLDAIAADHPPAAAVAMNAQKITGLANGSASTDAAAYGQTPAGGATAAIAHGGTGQTTAAAAFNALNPNAAPAGFLPSNPSGTVSTTQVMMGLGATCAYTPASSGKVLVNVTFGYFNSVASQQLTISAQYGTGTAPANGAALAGTLFGGSQAAIYVGDFPASSGTRPIAFTALLSLTAGTPYWFDIAVATNNSADAGNIQNVSMTMVELPVG